MGVSVAEGTVVAWHKQVGDDVALDETICEISTDKIDTDVPSPAAGRIVRVLVAEGQTVVVGAVLAEIDTQSREGGDPGSDAGGPTAAAVAAAQTLPRGVASATPAVAGAPTPAGGHLAVSSTAAQGVPAAPGGMARVAPGQSAEPDRAAGYSPVVRRIAAEHGIDLAQVVGTGRDGRVTKQDVLAHVAAPSETVAGPPADARAQAPAKAVEAAATPAPAPDDAVESSVTEARAQATAAAAGSAPPASTPTDAAEPSATASRAQATSEPLSRMRRAIGEHMVRSLRTAAHCTTIIEVDMARVEAARAVAGLSPLPYVARCLVESLGVFGRLNATLNGDILTRFADVDLGVAVSLGDRGLIVPVVRRAQTLSVDELAVAIRDLAARARANELTPDDVRGATFTITNPGRWGTIGATPIINQPQVGILDLEAIVRRPVVVGDGIAIRPICNLCLSWDHRALDGVLAAEFLADLRSRIENFS